MSESNHSAADIERRKRNLQRDAGDGNSAWADDDFDTQSLYSDYEGHDVATTFFHWDPALPQDADRDKWKELAELNYGKRDKDSASRSWRAGKINDAELFCGHLEFDERKTEKVVEMVTTVDHDEFGTYTTEQVLVGMCSLVADEDTENFDDRIITTDEFKELMEVTGLGSREHNKIRRIIRERTEFF